VPTLVAAWDDLLVGPASYSIAKSVRAVGTLGRPIEPGEFVEVDATDSFTLGLPDPRRAAGRSIAVTVIAGTEPVFWQAFPGTLVNGVAMWSRAVGAQGGYVFVSNGAQWRVIGLFNGA
jgi:hypothetical protein